MRFSLRSSLAQVIAALPVLASGVLAPLLLGLNTSGCGFVLKSSFPPPQLSASSRDVSAPVEIFLDSLGIPHISASSEDDAAFAVGFMHARDRSFQLELVRLASQGRLSEMLGKSMLQTDRRLRILTLHIDEVLENTDGQELKRLEAYCRGVNQGLELNPEPVEFKLLGHIPGPWTPRDVLLVGRFQAWDQSGDASLEALRDWLAASVPAETLFWLNVPPAHQGVPIQELETARRLRPSLPEVTAPPAGHPLREDTGKPTASTTEGPALPHDTARPPGTPDHSADSAATLEDPLSLQASLADSVRTWLELPRDGSNGWAVSGKHSTTGQPILAGDPHLALSWPPTFYEAHIHTPDVDVSGSTFPGLPMVIIGRASHVAWTLTNAFVDSQDLFRISVDPVRPDSYLLDGSSEPFIRWPQTFRWGKDAQDQLTEEFKVTRFGPLYNPGREDKLKPDTLYALSWPGFSGSALHMARSFDQLYRAKTAQEVQEAAALLPMPNQNWIFATELGQIGWVLGGMLPERRASPLPRNGATAASGWTEFLAAAQRPMLVDPPGGIVVASNQPVSSDVGRFHTYASGGYRSLRAVTALEGRSQWSAQDLRGLQVDITNLEAAKFLGVLRPLLQTSLPAELPRERQARLAFMQQRLAQWNCAMEADKPEALIYEAWRKELFYLLFSRHIQDQALLERFLRERLAEAPMEVALFTAEGNPWWDDPRTPVVEQREQTLIAAFVAAEGALVQLQGPDPLQWRWGRAHTLTPAHPFSSKKPLQHLFRIPTLQLSGGRHTLIALNHNGVVGDYTIESGPAMRQVIQYGGEYSYVLPGGNAGQPRHPHAFNQLQDWSTGEQHRVGEDMEYWRKRARSVLRFDPT